MPNMHWGDVILTATYLINRMPSRVPSHDTPLQKFKSCFPQSRLGSDLPLWIFGCTVFVHVSSHLRTKLEPRALKCVFLGYSSTQKGYKCYDPSSRKYFSVWMSPFFRRPLSFLVPRFGGECEWISVLPIFISFSSFPWFWLWTCLSV